MPSHATQHISVEEPPHAKLTCRHDLAAYDASGKGFVGLVEFQQRHRRRMQTRILVSPRRVILFQSSRSSHYYRDRFGCEYERERCVAGQTHSLVNRGCGVLVFQSGGSLQEKKAASLMLDIATLDTRRDDSTLRYDYR